MSNREFSNSGITRRNPATLKEIVEAGFRYKRLLLGTFALFALVVLIYTISYTQYESETKILVRRGRIDPLVSPDANPGDRVREAVTEEELNSEAEIVVSSDVLKRVVETCGLDKEKAGLHRLNPFSFSQNHERDVEFATVRLAHALDVKPLKKTNVLLITYRARTPERAAQVLRALNAAYIEKHMAVHRPTGQLKFFEQQAREYQNHLAALEQQLDSFSRGDSSVRPEIVRDQMLQQFVNLQGTIVSTRADIEGTLNRIHSLELEERSVPVRITTAVKRLDNPQLLQQLKGTLLNLELRHNELLSKYQKDYRPVQELEQEIEKTRAAIAREEASPLREDSTDADPTHMLIESELAKARATLSDLRARNAAMEGSVQHYEAAIHELETKGIAEQGLMREVRAAEQSYLLFVQKREESRITDELDRMHILNVVIAEEPTLPPQPRYPRTVMAAGGLFIAAFVSLGVVFLFNYFDPSFHVPYEIESILNLPVVAVFPRPASNGRNGHDPRNGHQRLNANPPFSADQSNLPV